MTDIIHFGFRHVALRVTDAQRASDFYAAIFGMAVFLKQDNDRTVIMTTPGRRDVLTLSEMEVESEMDIFERRTILPGTIDHVGFEVNDNAVLAHMVASSIAAGAELIGEIEMTPGYPSAFIRDPDGNVIQIYGFSEALRAAFPQK